ncbi:MAG: thioredoxin family protein [Campylobacterales bacterium]|nr:thioredoxin family protein [Campylobacterales bacterium]
MIKKFVFLLIFSTIVLGASLAGINIQKDFPTASKISKETKKRLMLFVYSDFCPYCDKMKRKTFTDADVKKFINDNYVFVMEKQGSATLPAQFDSDTVPMTYVLSFKTGEVLNEIPGYKTKEMFLQLTKECVTDY